MGFEPTSVSPHRISSPAPYQTRTTEPQPQKKELLKKRKDLKKIKKTYTLDENLNKKYR